MNFFIFFCLFSVIFGCNASFPKGYAFIKSVEVVGDPGEPLILTPLLKKNKIAEAQAAAKVEDPVFLNVTSYSGYFTVNDEFDSNMFFWFFPAFEDPSNAPVLLWLQGGPGASSMFGLFAENGPFEIINDSEVRLRNETWSRSHNLLYIDNPVGTGFSFTNGGYADNETKVGSDLYKGLQQFFTLFPNLRPNDFFIAGESYAGKYIPAIAHTILKKNVDATEKINLKGVAIGNGLSDPEHQLLYGERLFELGFIDSNLKKTYELQEKIFVKYSKAGNSDKAHEIASSLMLGSNTLFYQASGWKNVYNYVDLETSDEIDIGSFLTKTETRKAIHVGKITFGDHEVAEHLTHDMMLSVKSWVSQIVEQIRVLYYNGQLDLLIHYPGQETFLEHLEFSGAKKLKIAERKIWRVNGEVAGYVREAGKLVDVLVRNAGHMVPSDQPEWALHMITKFIRNQTIY